MTPQNSSQATADLLTLGETVATLWASGDPQTAITSLSRVARDPNHASPGMLYLSPQAAPHLGHSISKVLLTNREGTDHALALATILVASPEPGLRMIGPHVLTPFARQDPGLAKRMLDIAKACFDGAGIAALVIPLTAAAQTNPTLAGASLTTASPDLSSLIDLVTQAVARRSPSTARQFALAIRKGPSPACETISGELA